MKETEIFADGIGQINFAGRMVRFDFVTIRPDEDGKTSTGVTQRIIMPLQGFLSAYGSMQELIGKLIEAGVLKKNEQPAAEPEKAAKAAESEKTAKPAKAAKAVKTGKSKKK